MSARTGHTCALRVRFRKHIRQPRFLRPRHLSHEGTHMKRILLLLALASAAGAHELSISGTRFLLDGKPFPYTGISFFNAIYNPAFNQSSEERVRWLRKFQRYGINVLRVWSQW